MGSKFQIEGFEVGLSRWLRRPYIREISTGRTIYPNPSIFFQFDAAVRELASRKMSENDRYHAMQHLTLRMIGAALSPERLPIRDFRDLTPQALADEAELAASPPDYANEISDFQLKAGGWEPIFSDNSLVLYRSTENGCLQVSSKRNGQTVISGEAEAAQFSRILHHIAQPYPEGSQKEADAIYLAHRTVARALLEGEASSLHQVIFNQHPATAAQIIDASIM